VVRNRGAQALMELPKVTIGTVHSVKGGEADVVYLMPDLSTAGMREWDQPGLPRDSVVRLMYVGMTRAREELVVCDASSPMSVDPHLMVRGA
jgi:superfamily I DNA/RNA helicase